MGTRHATFHPSSIKDFSCQTQSKQLPSTTNGPRTDPTAEGPLSRGSPAHHLPTSAAATKSLLQAAGFSPVVLQTPQVSQSAEIGAPTSSHRSQACLQRQGADLPPRVQQHPRAAPAAANRPKQAPHQQQRPGQQAQECSTGPAPIEAALHSRPTEAAVQPDHRSGLRGRAHRSPASACRCFLSRQCHPSGPHQERQRGHWYGAIHGDTGPSPTQAPKRRRSHRASPLPARRPGKTTASRGRRNDSLSPGR
ncbi:hypothetical protein NDU88_005965 [Pleurodeles waltl]|uniref:Uncharacterized protein n=1 Tax=Pleurodeles waltl TaxID=8319 RepID=A0AAV7N1N7_PLEWA|nr:hypothetical protein NDU88_005965 [Pleurodeles waltl]